MQVNMVGKDMAQPVVPTSLRLDRFDRAFIALAGPVVAEKLLTPRMSQSDLIRYLVRVGAMSLGISQQNVLAAIQNGEVE